MKNLSWFKIYIILVLVISLGFIGFNILAQVEETEFDLKYYIKGGFDQASQCPNFIDKTELTMKDECTGLVWARYQLPSYHDIVQPTLGNLPTGNESLPSDNQFSLTINGKDCDNYSLLDGSSATPCTSLPEKNFSDEPVDFSKWITYHQDAITSFINYRSQYNVSIPEAGYYNLKINGANFGWYHSNISDDFSVLSDETIDYMVNSDYYTRFSPGFSTTDVSIPEYGSVSFSDNDIYSVFRSMIYSVYLDGEESSNRKGFAKIPLTTVTNPQEVTIDLGYLTSGSHAIYLHFLNNSDFAYGGHPNAANPTASASVFSNLEQADQEVSGGSAPIDDYIDMNPIINSLTIESDVPAEGSFSSGIAIPGAYGSTEPGYTWHEAYDSCTGFMTDINDSQPFFRLPTVEELLTLVKYQCDGSACLASIEPSIIADGRPFFSGGVYWTINDFNEPDHWINPDAEPIPGNPQRDYKRSVNLLTGEVDTPVFSELFRLSTWCIVDRNPEVVEKKFTDVTTVPITNGQAATGGTLKTVYNRKCQENDDCTTANVGTTCEDIPDRGKLCVKYDNYDSSNMEAKAIGCTEATPGYHIENNTCVLNPSFPYSECQGGENNKDRCTADGQCPGGTCVTACPSPEIEALGIPAYEAWKGSVFNGNRICRIDNCGLCSEGTEACTTDADCSSGTCINDSHRDPDSENCIPNKRPCYKEDLNGWTLSFVEDWNSGAQSWGECRADNCTFDAVLSGDPLSCECVGTVLEDVCIDFDPAEYHYEINFDYDNQVDCLVSEARAWDGELCYDEVLNDPGFDCSTKYCYDGTNFSTNYCQAVEECVNTCVENFCNLTGDPCDPEVCPAYTYDQCLPLEIKEELWVGGLFTGFYECSFKACLGGYHQNENDICVSDVRRCEEFPDFADVATQTWNGTDWDACVISTCVDNTTVVGSPITECQCIESIGAGGLHAEHDNSICSLNQVSCLMDDPNLVNINLYGLIESANKLWNETLLEWSNCYPLTCSTNKKCADGLTAGASFSDTICTTDANCTNASYPYCFPAKSASATATGTVPSTICAFDFNNSLSGTITDGGTGAPIVGVNVFLSSKLVEYTSIATVAEDGTITTETAAKKCAQKPPEFSQVEAETECKDDTECSVDFPVCLEGHCAEYLPEYSATSCDSADDCTANYSETECVIDSECSGVAGYPYCVSGFCTDSDKTSCSLPVLTNRQIGYNYRTTSLTNGTYSIPAVDIGLYDVLVYKDDYFSKNISSLLIEGAIPQNFQMWPDHFTLEITEPTGIGSGSIIDDFFRVYIDDQWVGDTSQAEPVLDVLVKAVGEVNQYKVDVYFKDSLIRALTLGYSCTKPMPPGDNDHITTVDINIIGSAEILTSPPPVATNSTVGIDGCKECFLDSRCVSSATLETATHLQGLLMGEISVYDPDIDIDDAADNDIIPVNAGKATFYINFPVIP
jgi:hypothetical protein